MNVNGAGPRHMIVIGREKCPYQEDFAMYRVGVRVPQCDWDETEYPSRYTLTYQEACAWAGVLSKVSGLPVEGVDVTQGGDTIQ